MTYYLAFLQEFFIDFLWILSCAILLFTSFLLLGFVLVLIILLFFRAFKRMFPGLCKEFFQQDAFCCDRRLAQQTHKEIQTMSLIPWFLLFFRR